MSDNLFKNSQCPIPPVPEVDFDFVTVDVCAPIPIPPPVFGCTTPVVPREPDTEVGLKCPEFLIDSTLQVGYAGDGTNNCTIDPTPRLEIAFRKTDVDPCNYDVSVDLNIPIPRPPCAPTVTPGQFNLAIGYEDCLEPGGTISVTKNTTPGDCTTPDECEFVLDLDLNIPLPKPPCPDIDVTGFKVTSGYGDAKCMEDTANKFSITRRIVSGDCVPDQCAYEFDLEIAVPLPRPPCPEINVNSFEVTTAFNDDTCTLDKQNKFVITTNHTLGDGCNTPDTCRFDIDFEVLVPIPRTPCPEISVNKFEVNVGFNDTACFTDTNNRFEIIAKHVPGQTCDDPGQCIFDVELEINVPIPRTPCPTLSINNFEVVTGFSDRECVVGKTSVFTITPRIIPSLDCNTPDTCEFDIDLSIIVPIPEPPCPEIKVKSFVVTSGFADRLCLDNKTNRFEITASKIAGTDCATPDRCVFDVELEIAVPIPKPPCPEINVKTFSLVSGYTGRECITEKENKFAITTRHAPGSDCNDPGQCIFDVELELAVPIPQPPCPQISVKNFSVTTGYAQQSCVSGKDNVFEITSKVIEGTDCNTPDRCEFEVNLELYVPIPQPPCPEINVKSFEVAAGYSKSPCVLGKENKFVITATKTPGNDCTEPDRCQFDVELEVVVPIPEPPCVELNAGTVTVASGFAGEPCVTGKENKITIRKTVTPASGCDTPEKCEFDIDIDIVVPIPRPNCPIIDGNGTFYGRFADAPAIRQGSFLSIVAVPADIGCEDSGTCSYFIDINVDIPIPRTPCPEINVASSQLRVDYDLSTELIFEIQPNHTIKTGTNEPNDCQFEVSLDINIGIPRPPCTIVSGGPVMITKLPASASPSGFISVQGSYSPGESCEAIIGMSLFLPQPCLTKITGGQGAVESGYNMPNKAILQVQQTDECSFSITPSISVKALTECPDIRGGSITVSNSGGEYLGGGQYAPVTGGKISVSTAQAGNTCGYLINVSLDTKGLSGGDVRVNAGGARVGSGNISIAGNKIDLTIDLDATNCPPGGGEGGGGEKGDKGDTGSTGPIGPRGPSGPIGPQGFMGPAGPMGFAGPPGQDGGVGERGMTGVSGPSGPTGPIGPSGPRGFPGLSIIGPSGTAGATGATGCKGEKGDPGVTGAQGEPGIEGPVGSTGQTGPIGPVGPSGLQGLSGPRGVTGLKGDKGDKGVTGATGAVGATGATGLRGITGPTGVAGATGATGATGAAGATGETGQRGISGPQGATGAHGASGATGVTGATGLRGEKGATGSTGLRGQTGVAGTNGATGPTGPRGVTGAVGPAGAAGATGPRGVTGVGTTGATGPVGPRGQTGVSGVAGVNGATGATGVIGVTGVTGATGPCGPAGSTGPQGPTPNVMAELFTALAVDGNGDPVNPVVYNNFKAIVTAMLLN